MDWVDLAVDTLMLAIALWIGRWMGRREERRKAPAPAPAVPVEPLPEVRTYTVEVGRLETFNVRARTEAQAIDDVASVALRGKEPGRYIAIHGERGTFIIRAPVVDNATPES